MGELVTEQATGSEFRSIRVFISYRREDTKGFARALKSDLSARYGKGQIFMDLDDIAPGEVWVDVIQTAVSECDAMIALIGKGWLLAQDDQKRPRLDNPLDPVRLEIEAALSEKLRVIPALLEGATMPPAEKLPEGLAELPRIQALPITDDWEAGLSRLVKALDKMVATPALGKVEDQTRPTQEAAQRGAEEHAGKPPNVAERMTKEQNGKSPPIILGKKRRRLLSAVLVITLIGAATAIVMASMAKSPTPGPTEGQSKPSSPSTGANDRTPQEQLKSFLPASISDSCSRSTFGIRELGTRASLECHPANGADQVDYHWFFTSARMEEIFNQDEAASPAKAEGSCSAGSPGYSGTWGKQGGQRLAGDFMCFLEDGEARIVWTYAGQDVFGHVVDLDGDMEELLDWWEDMSVSVAVKELDR